MDFINLHQDITHNCIDDLIIENVSDTFTRKIQSSLLSENDFLSAWELDKRPNYPNKSIICKFKGVSINQILDSSHEEIIIEKYRTTIKFKPQAENYYIKFKFKTNAGKIWKTPSDKDQSHCTFFKSDEFNVISHINQISIEAISKS